MNRLSFTAVLIIFCAFGVTLNAQTQDSYDYQSEFTWGINKNSFGFVAVEVKDDCSFRFFDAALK